MIGRVAITQPYVPRYRLGLWEQVIELLGNEGVSARVFYGGDAEQDSERLSRGDVTSPEWATRVRVKTVSLGRKLPKPIYRTLPDDWRGALLLTEMQVTNLNAWNAARRGQPFVTIGHGSSGTTASSGLAWRLEQTLNRSAERVLTYTAAGRAAILEDNRIDPRAVTSFENSTDTLNLRNGIEAVREEHIESFFARQDIPMHARVALYIGALRPDKNIDLLLDAATIVFGRTDDWYLVVVGDGPLRNSVNELRARTGRVVTLGHRSVSELSPVLKRAEVVLSPGRIGLIAVDALAVGLRVLGTSSSDDGPEVDYLKRFGYLLVSQATPRAYADHWLSLPTSPSELVPLSELPSIERSAATIAATVMAALRKESLS